MTCLKVEKNLPHWEHCWKWSRIERGLRVKEKMARGMHEGHEQKAGRHRCARGSIGKPCQIFGPISRRNTVAQSCLGTRVGLAKVLA